MMEHIKLVMETMNRMGYSAQWILDNIDIRFTMSECRNDENKKYIYSIDGEAIFVIIEHINIWLDKETNRYKCEITREVKGYND